MSQLRKVWRGVVACVVGAACVEGLAWILTETRIITPIPPMITMWPVGSHDDWRLAHITADTLREPDPRLFWRPVAAPPYTRQRFKGPVVDVPKPARVFRILCYGDSNTDGPERGAWPEALQGLLTQGSAGRYEVLNAGVAGYSSWQGLQRFREEVGVYQPDVVVVAFGFNDAALITGVPDDAYRVPPPPMVGLLRGLLHSRAWRLALSGRFAIGWYWRKWSEHRRLPVARRPRVSVEAYRRNLEEFIRTAQQHGSQAVLLTRPYAAQRGAAAHSAPEWLQLWRSSLPTYNACVRLVGEREGAIVVDVQRALAERGPEVFDNEVHLTLEGHALMADVVYRPLMEAIGRADRPLAAAAPDDRSNSSAVIGGVRRMVQENEMGPDG